MTSERTEENNEPRSNSKERLAILNILLSVANDLRERFGRSTTIGEIVTAMIAHHYMLRGMNPSVSELAALSGVPLSTVAGWIKRREYVELEHNPDDGRSRLVSVDDIDKRTEYLNEILRDFRDMQSDQGPILTEPHTRDFVRRLAIFHGLIDDD